jgi:replication factor C small subunit
MIFAGSAGVGKTSCAIAMARELYGENMGGAFLELNASDTRGIDVIRGKVKEFARTIPLSGNIVKIVFLDEADALTMEAQHALRRTMEKYASTTRFILSANYSSRIIEPIQSRCVVLRFKPLKEEDITDYMQKVCDKEGISVDKKAMEALIYVSEGDMRKATNVLQSAAVLGPNIGEKEIYDIAARARPKEIISMLRFALSGDFMNARNELNSLILVHGMSGEDILTQCYKEAASLEISDRLKLRLISAIGDYNFRIVEGANSRVQIEAMLAKMALFGEK